MPPLAPATRPRLSTAELEAALRRVGVDPAAEPLLVVGIRGYYRNTMGAPGVNDRGIYDDAIFLHTPSATAAFNGNTDPSRFRKGVGKGAAKGMACLNTGVWRVHRFDKHKGKYLALCQRMGPVTVTRDGDPPYEDTGDFGINIHDGQLHRHVVARLPDGAPGPVAELHRARGGSCEAVLRGSLEQGGDSIRAARFRSALDPRHLFPTPYHLECANRGDRE